jgi:hypothetical protein
MRFPNLFAQSLAVFSFGKTLHATGWKMGYIVDPEYLIKDLKQFINGMCFAPPAIHFSFPQMWGSGKKGANPNVNESISATPMLFFFTTVNLSHQV